MSAHTPTPWHVDDLCVVHHAQGCDWVVADCRPRSADFANCTADFKEQAPNAAFIITACNQHAALVAEVAELRAGLADARKALHAIEYLTSGKPSALKDEINTTALESLARTCLLAKGAKS